MQSCVLMVVFVCSWQERAHIPAGVHVEGKADMRLCREHSVHVYGKFTRGGRAHICAGTGMYLQLGSASKCECGTCAIISQLL